MKHMAKILTGCATAGLLAGTVNGIFGAAGGMVLLPALEFLAKIPEESLFPMSVCVMLPVCVVSLLCSIPPTQLPWQDAWPYLLGSLAGGCIVGIWGKRIPRLWLHRVLGIMILWGGIRYLVP